jgi:hypothetical protein
MLRDHVVGYLDVFERGCGADRFFGSVKRTSDGLRVFIVERTITVLSNPCLTTQAVRWHRRLDRCCYRAGRNTVRVTEFKFENIDFVERIAGTRICSARSAPSRWVKNILRRCDCLRELTGVDCSGNRILPASAIITASNNAITAIRAIFKYRIKRKLVAIKHLKICSKMPDNLTSLIMDTTLSVVCFFQHVFWCNALV